MPITKLWRVLFNTTTLICALEKYLENGCPLPLALQSTGSSQMLQTLVNATSAAAIYLLVALGFGLVYYTTQIFFVAHGALFSMSAFTAYLAISEFGISPAAAVALAALSSASVGVVVDHLVHRPLDHRRADAQVHLVASLGTYIVLVNLIALAVGNETRVLHDAVTIPGAGESVRFSPVQQAYLFVALLVVICYYVLLRRTRFGLYCRALADHPLNCELLGMRIGYVRFGVFALGSGLVGMAGGLSLFDYGADPFTGFTTLLIAITACVIGGQGVLLAPVAGALLLAQLHGVVGWYLSARWVGAISFAMLLLVLVYWPQGLFGIRGRVEEI